MTAIQFATLAELPSFSPIAGAQMQLIAGDAIAMNLVTLDPGALVPEHSHPNEQAGYVVSGAITMTIGGEAKTLTSGMAYIAPGGAIHSGLAGPEGCEVIDIFSPPRQDYVEMQARAIESAG